MMKAVVTMTIAAGFLGSMGCSPANTGLTVTPLPQNPIVIPVAQNFTVAGGAISLSSPLFVMAGIGLSWSGQTKLEIMDIEFILEGGTGTNGGTAASQFSCSYAGDQLATLMNGNPTLSAAPSSGTPTVTQTTSIGCGGLPTATTTGPVQLFGFSYPMQLVVTGVTIDNSGNYTGRITGYASINAQ